MLCFMLEGRYDPANGPRKEMLYCLDTVLPDGGIEAAHKRLTRAPNSFLNVTALRIGDWKLVEGYPGRGDWYGEDPSLAWPVDYVSDR